MKTSIIVQNLKCGGCAKTITNALESLKGINEVAVAVETSTVSFQSLSMEDALSAKTTLKSLGYPSMDTDNSLLAKAKSFVSCATGKMNAS
jgi:copper chaperone